MTKGNIPTRKTLAAAAGGRSHPSAIHTRILNEVLSLPTAPFAEHHVVDYVRRFCAAREGVTITIDKAGNLLVRVRVGSRRVSRPVCITAHLDHPGFVADKMIGKGRLRAFWRGGVPPEYFVGSGVRFFVDGRWVPGQIVSTKTAIKEDRELVETAEIELRSGSASGTSRGLKPAARRVPLGPAFEGRPHEEAGRRIDATAPLRSRFGSREADAVPRGAVGMWDFPDPQIKGDRIYARGCDDLAGAAAMLCAIDELVRSGRSCDAYFLFTRAEEVGFVGAIAACRLKTIPKKCFVVAMETSSERPHAKIGDGPVLRVGDRASTFTHPATAYCHRIARELEQAGRFQYQRKLMDGGTCESSAYCRLGYEATGICVALGNYHNVDAKRKRLGPEYISLSDFGHVVRWFVELARAPRPYTGDDDQLDGRLARLESGYRKLLYATVRQPR
jgi:endoglucanase